MFAFFSQYTILQYGFTLLKKKKSKKIDFPSQPEKSNKLSLCLIQHQIDK